MIDSIVHEMQFHRAEQLHFLKEIRKLTFENFHHNLLPLKNDKGFWFRRQSLGILNTGTGLSCFWQFLWFSWMIDFQNIWASKYEVEILHWICPLSDMNGPKWYPCWQISLWIKLFFKQLWLLIFPGCRQLIYNYMFSHFEALMHTVISTLIFKFLKTDHTI